MLSLPPRSDILEVRTTPNYVSLASQRGTGLDLAR